MSNSDYRKDATFMAEYRINEHGTIQTPGKFEAEPAYAPYFYDFVMDGAQAETIMDGETSVDVFIVDDEDRAVFPELLADVYAVLLWQDSNGFVNTRKMDSAQLDRFRAECENADTTEDDGPQEDDLTTTDHRKFYQSGKLVLIMGEPNGVWSYRNDRGAYVSLDVPNNVICEKALRAYMDRVQFWPNVWFVSDHGNAHLIDITEGK